MKLSTVVIFLFCLSHFVYGQADSSKNKHYRFSAILGVARERFQVSGVTAEEYPSLGIRLGGGISRTFGNIQIRSGLNVCFRAKGKSYLIDDIYYYGKGVLLLHLDETASKRNHIGLEIPLSLKVLLNQKRTHLSAGFMGRFWQPTSLVGDVLKSQQEIGYIAGASHSIFSNLSVGIEFYGGLNTLHSGAWSSGGLIGLSQYYVKNRFSQITLEYTF